MRLALEMRTTLRGLRSQIDASEYPLWAAWHEAHGWPSEVIAHTVAIGAAAACQVHGAAVRPQDLLPRYQDRRDLTPGEIGAVLRGWAKANNRGASGRGKRSENRGNLDRQ